MGKDIFKEPLEAKYIYNVNTCTQLTKKHKLSKDQTISWLKQAPQLLGDFTILINELSTISACALRYLLYLMFVLLNVGFESSGSIIN